MRYINICDVTNAGFVESVNDLKFVKNGVLKPIENENTNTHTMTSCIKSLSRIFKMSGFGIEIS